MEFDEHRGCRLQISQLQQLLGERTGRVSRVVAVSGDGRRELLQITTVRTTDEGLYIEVVHPIRPNRGAAQVLLEGENRE